MFTTVTRADLRDRLRTMWEGVPFWTEDDANDALNEALRAFNLFTGYWRQTETLPGAAATHEYALSGILLYRTRLLWEGLPLYNTSMWALSNLRPNWWLETAGETGVPTRPYLWAPMGLQLVMLWPAPAGGGTLTVEGSAETPSLEFEDDSLDLGRDQLQAIVGMALHLASFKEGAERFEATKRYYTDFLTYCVSVNSDLKQSSLFRPFAGLDMDRGFRPTTKRGARDGS